MFVQFSWKDFFSTIITLMIIYYPIVLVLYYRTEVVGFFKRIFQRQSGLMTLSPFSNHSDLKKNNNESSSILNEEEIIFASPRITDINSTESSDNAWKDIKEEVRDLIILIKETEGDSNDFKALFTRLLQNNRWLLDSHLKNWIILFSLQQIRFELPFTISTDEMDSCFVKANSTFSNSASPNF